MLSILYVHCTMYMHHSCLNLQDMRVYLSFLLCRLLLSGIFCSEYQNPVVDSDHPDPGVLALPDGAQPVVKDQVQPFVLTPYFPDLIALRWFKAVATWLCQLESRMATLTQSSHPLTLFTGERSSLLYCVNVDTFFFLNISLWRNHWAILWILGRFCLPKWFLADLG